jgi:hypothetical protein
MLERLLVLLLFIRYAIRIVSRELRMYSKDSIYGSA